MMEYRIEGETTKHRHLLIMECGEMQMLLEILHIAHDSSKLGIAAQKTCKELWDKTGKAIKLPRHG